MIHQYVTRSMVSIRCCDLKIGNYNGTNIASSFQARNVSIKNMILLICPWQNRDSPFGWEWRLPNLKRFFPLLNFCRINAWDWNDGNDSTWNPKDPKGSKFPCQCGWWRASILGVFGRYESNTFSRWWFQIFFIFTPSWGNDPIWLIFFRWVETTN